jgi:hypothetical protein
MIQVQKVIKGLQKVHPHFTAHHLTHYGGLYPLYYFFNAIHLRRRFERGLVFQRKHEHYSTADQLLLILTSIIVGLDRLALTRQLHQDNYVQHLLGLKDYPVPSTIRRFLHSWRKEDLEALVEIHNKLRSSFLVPAHMMTINLDTTVLTVYGETEGSVIAYNPQKRNRPSYQAFIGSEALSETTLQGELISGKRVSGAQTTNFVMRCLHRIPLSVEGLRLRADSGFYCSEVVDFLEDRGFHYAIVARVTKPIKARLAGLRYEHAPHDWQASSFSYQPINWRAPRRYIVIRHPLKQDDDDQLALFPLERYAYRVLVTNLDFAPYQVWRFYKQRAKIELAIKELKNDFPLGKIPTRLQLANSTYAELILLAYDLLIYFKTRCLPAKLHHIKLETLRHALFWEPAEFIRRGNRNVIKFQHNSPLQGFLPFIERRIHALKIS